MLATPAAFAQDAPTPDDLRALRYYVEQDEQAAVTAELRRLRTAFPDWTPPEDPAALVGPTGGPAGEVDDIYAAIARGDVAAARRMLSETRRSFPDWTPPGDMTNLLATAEAQGKFDTALSRGDAEGALRIGLATPELLRCTRINNTWRLAELEQSRGRDAAALAAYRQIVGSCSGESDLIATIEKADAVASEADLRALITLAGNRLPGSRAALAAVQSRLLAGRGGADAGSAATPPAAAKPATPAAAPSAGPAPAPVAAPAAAQPATPAPGRGVVAAAAVASPLSRLPASGDGRVGSTRSAAQAGDFRDCTERSTNPRSLDIAYERAWCVYNLERPLEALALFTAAANGPLSGVVKRDARYGMALALLKQDMTDAASRIAAETDFDTSQRRTVEGIILDQRGVRAFAQGDYPAAIRYLNALETLDGSLRRDLGLLRGYAYLNGGDKATARTLFERLNSELETPESRAGLRASRS
ncbi:tetratricopeptide repeat protein [Loktanella fryxellensis]|nr:tetratricopeptide repeat protein [Loktanella fryxellensis]